MNADDACRKEGGDSADLDTTGGTLDTSGDDLKQNNANDYLKLPESIKRRVRALKKLQYETVKVDVAFYKELFELELKYDPQHQQIFEKRKAFITGDKEPNDSECDWPSDAGELGSSDDEVDNLCKNIKDKVAVSADAEESKDAKGIPDFWLKTMRSISLLDEMIKDHDVDILKHLTDIRCTLHTDEPGFTLEFHFSANVYFTDSVLTKRYFFNYDVASHDDALEYEGPEIVRAKGCAINWYPGKNVTVKIIKKVQKRKGSGAKRTVSKSVKEDSFFNFFDLPTETLSDDMDEDTEMLLESDFKIGQFIRDTVIPRAVLYYTGDAIDSDFEDDLDDEDDDEDDDEEDDDQNDADENLHRKRKGHHSGGHGKTALPTAEQPECKQQ